MLSQNQVRDVCLAFHHDEKRCRYLAQDSNDGNWYCLKKSTKRSDIDEEIKEYLKEMKKKGLDPTKQGVPLGDNCTGFPILKNIVQGN